MVLVPQLQFINNLYVDLVSNFSLAKDQQKFIKDLKEKNIIFSLLNYFPGFQDMLEYKLSNFIKKNKKINK